MIGKESSQRIIKFGAVRSPHPKETTDLRSWHKHNVKMVRAFLLLQAKQKPRRMHRTVFSVARLRRPRDDYH